MKTIDYIESSTTQSPGLDPRNGEKTKLQSNEQHSSNESKSGKQLKRPSGSRLLTKEAACKRLGCHWQTLLYRERKGDLTGIRIGKRKYYVMAEIDLLKATKPVHNKPNKTKLLAQCGGPGSGIIIGPAIVAHQQPKKPTLWNRIIAFFAR